MYQLRKVKGIDNTYKVYNNGERPVVKISRGTFIDNNHVKIDNQAILKILDIEKNVTSIVCGNYSIIGSIKTIVHEEKKMSVVRVDSTDYDDEQAYTIVLKCRSVKYIGELAVISWVVEIMSPLDEDDSNSEEESDEVEDDESNEEDESDEDEIIEAPTEELVAIKCEIEERVRVLYSRLEELKSKLETYPLNDIPLLIKDIDDIYNEEAEK